MDITSTDQNTTNMNKEFSYMKNLEDIDEIPKK